MKYVIDACNLIFCESRLEDTLENRGFPAVRDLLVGWLERYARTKNLEGVLAVFDGSEKAAHRTREERLAGGRVVCIYSDPRTKADRFIIDFVEAAREPGSITVVSNDKFIIRHVKGAGGRHLNCREFLRRLRTAERRAAPPDDGEDPRKYKGLSPREVEQWMKYFDFRE